MKEPLTPATPVARKYFQEDLETRKAELEACENGTWPRNISDHLRYYPPPHIAECPVKTRKYVANLCRKEIAWLEAKLNA